MSSNEMAISVQGLKKAYKNVPVLNGISFQAEKGSIYALLGSNGAGKTTTIRILTTLLKPDSGEVTVCGFNILKQPEKIREVISLTGQNTAVDDILTGRENLSLISKLRHIPTGKAKADELLRQFDLTDAADRRVATYSGGMRRRLDLAMSLLGAPKVLFLDEPTTGLDPQARIAVWHIVKGLADAGLTVFLTTQYLEEADQLADHIAILHKGTIVAHGTAAELKKMLPSGHIELRFENEQTLHTACGLLHDFEAKEDTANQTLSVSTDGSVSQLTAILGKLEQENLAVAEFAQKLPTLDDVFLSIVGGTQKEEGR